MSDFHEAPEFGNVADPKHLLSRERPSRSGGNVRLLLLVAAGILVAQVVMPPFLQPFTIVGKAVADFQFQYLDAVNKKEVELAEDLEIAQAIARLESIRAQALALCALIPDYEMVFVCRAAANKAADDGIAAARASLDRK